MKYGDIFEKTYKNTITGEKITTKTFYKRASWGEYHTNDEGDGLWENDRQILGTCQFTVAGCKNEKSAIAKIRKYVNG